MKKVLIWDTFPRTNTGGPSGYLYNLREYLLTHPSEQICFFTDLVLDKYADAEWLHPEMPDSFKPKTPIGQIWKQLRRVYYKCIKPFWGIEYSIPQIAIDDYDFVHFHQVNHVQQFRKLFPCYKGKLILTSHCPCTSTDERIYYTAREKSKLHKLLSLLRPFILKKECEAYDRVNYIMFPCEGARESYEKDSKMKETFLRNNYKFFYVPTGIVDYLPKKNQVQKFSDFGIPKDAFVITYFGRHIAVKGYDVLSDIGIQLLEENSNLYILCAGNGEITPPQHSRWIELGFIHNVDDLLPQCDLYILANKETYFDLITLQILRAGVPLILSSTGGNKYFAELPNEETVGLSFFDIHDKKSLISLAQEAINVKSQDSSSYKMKGKYNRELYEKYFTLDKYTTKYCEFLNHL